MFIKNQKVIKILRTSLLVSLSITLAMLFNIKWLVFSVMIVIPIQSLNKFNFHIIAKRIISQITFASFGIIISELFQDNLILVALVGILIYCLIYKNIKTKAESQEITALIFYFNYGLIQSSYSLVIEDSVYDLVKCSLYIIPLSWVLFKLLPSKECVKVNGKNIERENLTDNQRLYSICIMSLSLLSFLYFNFNTAVFCLVVVGGFASSYEIKKSQKIIDSIIPVQIGGCLLGTIINFLLLDFSNLISIFFIIFLYTSVIMIFSTYEKIQYRIINNFELSLLVGTLIPFTLYSTPNSIDIQPFIHRGYDMLITYITLSIVLYFIRTVASLWLEPDNGNNAK
ncbi:hypothetical protein ACRTC3_11560 [Photobacterium damselae]|uniref:hypothetical protein n=1 Tax=Photobacterium damselae TaxID=38293 RepID=UPI003D7D5104